MGKPNIFEISFTNQSGIYYAGNFVDGHVTLELIKPMDMLGLTLTFKGQAKVIWITGSGSTQKTYSDKEVYFDENVNLFGYTSDISTELPAGRHSFPFRWKLPEGLPSSYEERDFSVRYHVSCMIDKPWTTDHETKRLFTVISILDLNTSPDDNLAPVWGDDQKRLCCLCCKSGEITAQFSIDRTGWVPGEAIKLHADIKNGSGRTMKRSYVDLKMITTCYADGSLTMKTKDITRVTRPSIAAFGEDTWRDEQLVIPPLPPSFLGGCNIIDIQYYLQLNVDPSRAAVDLEVCLPIIIGTIPLMSVVQQNPPMAPNYSQFGTGEALYPSPPTQDISIPLPSYMERITGKKAGDDSDKKHTQARGKIKFAPAYPYYNWGHTPGALPGK